PLTKDIRIPMQGARAHTRPGPLTEERITAALRVLARIVCDHPGLLNQDHVRHLAARLLTERDAARKDAEIDAALRQFALPDAALTSTKPKAPTWTAR
ncbi:hypothetical protein, partial [Haematospirillum jordaniae]